MKNYALYLLVLLNIFGCKKEDNQEGSRLRRVTVNGKVNESFEYNASNQIIKDNFLAFARALLMSFHMFIKAVG